MTQVSIVYFSGYGHTKRLAGAVLEGLKTAGATAELITVDAEGNIPDAAWDTLAASQAIIFGSPTYMGSVSWQFKKFADASSKIWFTLGWKNKLFAGFTNSASLNGDKHSTIAYMMTLAMQHGGFWVGMGMPPANTKAATRGDLNYLGSASGMLAQSPSDSSAEEGPPQGDLDTAKAFAARVVTAAQLFKTAA